MLRLALPAILALSGLLSAAETPRLVAPDAHKHLMLDTRVMLQTVNAKLTPGTVRKEPRNPLFTNDKPWENALNNLYPNLLWDEEEQCFKLWYKCVLADKEVIAQMDQPSTVHDVGWYLLYATSKDGITWTKPELGLHKFNSDARTNIVARDTPNVGVFKDRHDPDPARRYKMVYDIGLGKPQTRFSPDGIHWGETVAPQGFGSANCDTHNNAFFDERSGKYLWFTKLYLGERLVGRLESEDFLHWKNSGLVMRSTLAEGRSHQTYANTVFRYANVYLGYTMMYHVGDGRRVDVELAWSPDSVHWERVSPGQSLIRNGPGAYDSGCAYAMAGPPVAQGKEMLIFYGGDHAPHTGWKRSCLPCLARLPLDHFAGYEQLKIDEPATLMTRAFRVTGEPVCVTADTGKGMLRVAAIDGLGATADDAVEITGNVLDAPLKWKHDGINRLKGQLIHLQLELSGGAKLYAISGLEMVDTALPVPLNPLASPHRKAAPAQTRRVDFISDAQGWKGTDKLEHHAEDGGFVQITREGRQLPIARSPVTPELSPLAGNWPELLGGNGAELRCRVRAPKAGGKVRLEIFASDVGQWSFETSTTLGTEWAEAVASLRYSWSDEEAAAAGWTRAVSGFSWSETMQHVGQIVITPGTVGAQSRFDVDWVQARGLE